MSVVNEQAENIVQEAVESKAFEAAAAALSQPAPAQPVADEVRASDLDIKRDAPAPEATGGNAVDACHTPVPKANAASPAEVVELQAPDPDPPVNITTPVTGDALADAEAQLAKVVESGDALESMTEKDAAQAADRREPALPAGGPTRDEFSPKNAERTVNEIESGIRKLGDILSAEVSEQWRQAKETFEQLAAARARTEEAEKNAAAMLQQIIRLREETQIARDDADVARREAKLLREDARIAKERADVSANAAEAAADQVSQEALHARERATGGN